MSSSHLFCPKNLIIFNLSGLEINHGLESIRLRWGPLNLKKIQIERQNELCDQ